MAWPGPVLSGPGTAAPQAKRWPGCTLEPRAQSASLVRCLPFQVDIALFPLLSQEGEECDCTLCHGYYHKVRDPQGQKPRFLFLPARRR